MSDSIPIAHLHYNAKTVCGHSVLTSPLRHDPDDEFSQRANGLGKAKVPRRFFGEELEIRRNGLVVSPKMDIISVSPSTN